MAASRQAMVKNTWKLIDNLDSQRDPARTVDTQPAQRREHPVNGLAGDIGLHHVTHGLHRNTGQHRHVGSTRLGKQQLPNRIAMNRRRDHPDVQHGSSEASAPAIMLDTTER